MNKDLEYLRKAMDDLADLVVRLQVITADLSQALGPKAIEPPTAVDKNVIHFKPRPVFPEVPRGPR